MRDFTNNQKAKLYTNTALGLAAISAFALILSQAFVASPAVGQAAKKSTTNQRVVNAPVTYWLDMSNGGSGMMPAMPFGMGGGDSNVYGDAWTGSPGKHADIAVYNNTIPAGITAKQAIPKGLKLGNSINLIPRKLGGQSKEHEVYKKPDVNFTMKFYWGCGPNVRAGQPRVIQIVHNQVTSNTTYNDAWNGRGEPNRRPPTTIAYSHWPNERDRRNIASDALMGGSHAVSGTGVPASLQYAIDNVHDFMGDLGLASSGDKSGNINFTWNSVPNAKAYFVNAMGMRGLENGNNGEMIIWSSSDVMDPGHGLLNYLSNTNVGRFLSERALMPTSQTSCMSPRGIFANSDMVMAQGIGYGEETNIVYPPRPTDANIPWIQEWTAQIRNKTNAMLLVGMPSMRDMMGGGGSTNVYQSEEPAAAPTSSNPQTGRTNSSDISEEQRQRNCENAAQSGQNAGSSAGSDAGWATGGDWRAAAAGRALGGLLGRGAAKKGNSNCQAPPAQPKGN